MTEKQGFEKINQMLQQIIQSQPDRLMDVKEVAKVASVSVDQIWTLKREGLFPAPVEIKRKDKKKGATKWLHSDIMIYIKSLPKQEQAA